MESILTALIGGAVTLCGVLIANSKNQAVTETKLEELTREVREHNNFAKRMPVVESKLERLQADVEELYGYHKPSM